MNMSTDLGSAHTPRPALSRQAVALLSATLLVGSLIAFVGALFPFGFIGPAVLLGAYIAGRTRVAAIPTTVRALTLVILVSGLVAGLALTFLLTPVDVVVE